MSKNPGSARSFFNPSESSFFDESFAPEDVGYASYAPNSIGRTANLYQAEFGRSSSGSQSYSPDSNHHQSTQPRQPIHPGQHPGLDDREVVARSAYLDSIRRNRRLQCAIEESQDSDLISNNYFPLIEHILSTPTVPIERWSRLVGQQTSERRSALADNKNTPLDCLYVLAADDDPTLRYQLAENHQIPLEVLQLLASDENPYVACRAEKTIVRLHS